MFAHFASFFPLCNVTDELMRLLPAVAPRAGNPAPAGPTHQLVQSRVRHRRLPRTVDSQNDADRADDRSHPVYPDVVRVDSCRAVARGFSRTALRACSGVRPDVEDRPMGDCLSACVNGIRLGQQMERSAQSFSSNVRHRNAGPKIIGQKKRLGLGASLEWLKTHAGTDYAPGRAWST
jgi:hypothetical protein